MLEQWLAPIPVQTFVRECLGKRPVAMPGTARGALPLLDWNALDAILGRCPPADVLVVARGEVMDTPPPRSLAETRALMNTVDRHTPMGGQPDFTLFSREHSPLATARLIPGDWLYLPSRWWHMAKCVEDSLSISAGLLPRLVV